MYIYSIIIQFCISDTTKRLQRYNFFFVSFNIYRKMRNFARKFTTKMNKTAQHIIDIIIRKTKCYRFTKRNAPKRKTKRLRYRCPPEPYSNSVRTDFFSYSNAIILENQQINTSI